MQSFLASSRRAIYVSRYRYDRSTLFISKRYATAPMPFRPGYGLGSIIQPIVIEGMKTEAQQRSKLLLLEQIISDVESQEKSIENERSRLIATLKVSGEWDGDAGKAEIKEFDGRIRKQQQQRYSLETRRQIALEELLKVMTDLIDSGNAPTTFDSGAMSPVDWGSSKIDYFNRAYDSIKVNASFHVKEEQSQSSGDFASGVASSTSANAETDGFWFIPKSKVESMVNTSVQNASSRSKDRHVAQSVLVLSAFATHKKVQQFEKLRIDQDKLVKAWNYNFPGDQIDVTDILCEILPAETFDDGLFGANDKSDADKKEKITEWEMTADAWAAVEKNKKPKSLEEYVEENPDPGDEPSPPDENATDEEKHKAEVSEKQWVKDKAKFERGKAKIAADYAKWEYKKSNWEDKSEKWKSYKKERTDFVTKFWTKFSNKETDRKNENRDYDERTAEAVVGSNEKKETDGYAMNEYDKKYNKLSMLTECFLGSTMIGMVHFIRQKETTQSQRSRTSDVQMASKVEFSSWLSSITGSTQLSTNSASKIANMLSTDEVDVKFDLQCLGYLPKLHSSNIEMAIQQFANFDPAKWHKETANVISSGLQIPDSAAGLKDNKELTVRQSNMGSVIESSIMALTKAESLVKTSVLDMETFMNAFDDYAAKAPDTDGIGVPVGMNVLSFNKTDVINLFAKQALGAVMVKKDNQTAKKTKEEGNKKETKEETDKKETEED
eukprot:223779_1